MIVTWKTLVATADGVNEAVALLRERNPWLIGGLIAYLAFDVMDRGRRFAPSAPARRWASCGSVT